MTRNPYPRDGSDKEGAVVAPSLTGSPKTPHSATTRCAPPFPPPCGGAGGAGGAQRVVALRGVFGHEGQGGSAAPEPVEATKARSSSLTSLG